MEVAKPLATVRGTGSRASVRISILRAVYGVSGNLTGYCHDWPHAQLGKIGLQGPHGSKVACRAAHQAAKCVDRGASRSERTPRMLWRLAAGRAWPCGHAGAAAASSAHESSTMHDARVLVHR